MPASQPLLGNTTMLNRLAAAAALALVLATPAFADTLVVTAARMVDVERGRYVENPVVVVTDGRITAVGTAVPAGLPAVLSCPHCFLTIRKRSSQRSPKSLVTGQLKV
jgi:predicted RNA-binding protein